MEGKGRGRGREREREGKGREGKGGKGWDGMGFLHDMTKLDWKGGISPRYDKA